jgi:hypothetical protein
LNLESQKGPPDLADTVPTVHSIPDTLSSWRISFVVNRNDGRRYLPIPVEPWDPEYKDRSVFVLCLHQVYEERLTDMKKNRVIDDVEDLTLVSLELTGDRGEELYSRPVFIQDLVKKPTRWNHPSENLDNWVRTKEGMDILTTSNLSGPNVFV